MLATAASYYIKLWNLNNENDIVSVKEKSSCMPHGSSNVLCMEWTQDSSLIGTAGSDGCLVLCIPETGIFSEVIPTGRLKNSKNDEIHTMKFYNKSNLIAFGGSGKIVKCWDRQHNKFINNFTGHSKTITSMDINHSETSVCSVSENGDILINSLDGKATILKNISANPLNKLIFSKNSNSRLFCIDDHGNLYSYDTINLVKDSQIQIGNASSINDITISPLNNNILVTANEEGSITFIDSLNKKIVNTYEASDPLTSVSIRMDGSMLACGSSKGQVLLYDIRMNKPLHKYWAETKSIKTLSFQKINTNNNNNNNNRKRTQSILENNTINPKKHMLSSESEDIDTLRNKSSESSLRQSTTTGLSQPTTLQYNSSSSPNSSSGSSSSSDDRPIKNNDTISNNNNNSAPNTASSHDKKGNLTSSLLSAFSSKKFQPPKFPNFFPSNVNPPFDYNFSKNKSQNPPITTTTTTITAPMDTDTTGSKGSGPTPLPPPLDLSSIDPSHTNHKGKGSHASIVPTFSEFLKNNYAKGTSSEEVPTRIDPLHPSSNATDPTTTTSATIFSNLPSSSTSKTFNLPNDTKITPKLKNSSLPTSSPNPFQTPSKEQTRPDPTAMEVDPAPAPVPTPPTAPFPEIWLNPEIFSTPPDQEKEKLSKEPKAKEKETKDNDMEEQKETSQKHPLPDLLPSFSKSFGSSGPSGLFGPSSSTSFLFLSDPMKGVEGGDGDLAHEDTAYDQYLDERSNLLREKLQTTIRQELGQKGISVVQDSDPEHPKLEEGLTTVSNKILESVVEEGLQELKGFLRNDIKNMHLEIIGQFHFQKYEIEKMFKEQQEKIGPLLTELQKLREENERLKCQLYKT